MSLDAHDNLVWADLDICPRSAPSQGAKLCTNKVWFLAFILTETTSSCHCLAVTVMSDMRRLLRFRMGCHSLPIEIGRHAGIARSRTACAELVALGRLPMRGILFLSAQHYRLFATPFLTWCFQLMTPCACGCCYDQRTSSRFLDICLHFLASGMIFSCDFDKRGACSLTGCLLHTATA